MYIINWQLCAFALPWKTCYILSSVSFFSQNYSLEKKYSWMSFCQHISSAGSRIFVRLLWWQIWKNILFNSTTVKSNCLICHTAGAFDTPVLIKTLCNCAYFFGGHISVKGSVCFFYLCIFYSKCVCTHLTIHARWGSLLHSSIWSLWLRGHSWLRRCRWGRSNAVRGSWTLLCCNCWGSCTNGTQMHRRSEDTQMPDIETRQLNKFNFQR